ncbi:MAG: ABC transporter permease [Bacteroidota bacterium]
MIRNYFTTAWRNFIRHKTFSLINIFGLTLGMAACLLILQYVTYEQSYDTFHSNKSDLYRVAQNRYNKGHLETAWAAGCGAIGMALKDNFPEVKAMSTIRYLSGTMNYDDRSFREDQMYLVMPDFFRMFDFPILKGNPAESFSQPFQAMISESRAKRYFGDEDPIGKTVHLNRRNDFTIVGVFEDIPENSHMKFDWLFSYETYVNWTDGGGLTAWQWDGFYTYIQLHAQTDPDAFEAKIPPLVEEQAGEELREYDAGMEFYLQPVDQIHLTSDLMMEMEANGNGEYVRFLMIIAIFILFIAWVNYINLSTAKSAERAREVGIRKVLGSHRASLIRQFLMESLATNLAAAGLAIGVAYVCLPWFNSLTGQEISFQLFRQGSFWLAFASVLVVGSILSGLYPAFVLASFQPDTVLKGSYSSSSKGILLRKLLVGFQFGVSLLLIAGTLTVYRQLDFMRSRDLGVNIEQTLVLNAPNVSDSTYSEKLAALKSELTRVANIESVSASTAIPGRKPGWNAGGVRRVGEPASAANQYRVIGVDYTFIDAYELEILTGRAFDQSYGTDEGTVLFNESAVKLMGFASIEEAMHEDIYFWGDTFTIIGVLADYHQQSLKVAPDPLIFRLIPSSRSFFSVKINTNNSGESLQNSIAHVSETWDKFFAGSPMEYFFLDEYFDEQYKNDRTFGGAFASFALLAILVACMGLFGLSAYSATQRTKEVGIRKVMGASGPQIVQLLTREIMLLIAWAALVALPLAWYAMDSWLTGYAYRIELDWTLFVGPLLSLVVITLATVSVQTLKTAATNPVEAMRHE